MSRKSKYTEAFTARLTKDWAERLVAVSDHPKVEEDYASVIRDCIEFALPHFELTLGIVSVADDGGGITEEELAHYEPAQTGWGPDRGRG